jgi:N-formylglutamate amidohydrolase
MSNPKVTGDKPFLISIPHSGEKVPLEAPWLKGLPETLLMFDVDRFVDRLYQPVIERLHIPFVKTDWHRYAIDLNRWPDDVDADSVRGHVNPSGKFSRGLHWVITTMGERLMPEPMAPEVHEALVTNYFEPFHRDVRALFAAHKARGASVVYHIDAHSMPSVGTNEHRDPGKRRADVVISDCSGTTCSTFFKDLVINAFEKAGFTIAYNWPYLGGRVTETYGKPALGQESIQVELNRGLYMNEQTKGLLPAEAKNTEKKLSQAIEAVYAALPKFP